MKRSAQKRGQKTVSSKPPPLPVLYSLKPDLEESHDSGTLLVWGDIPYWQVVETELYDLIKLLRKGSTLHDAARTLAYARGHTICSTLERLKKVIAPLIKEGVIRSSFSRGKAAEEQSSLENITVNITRRCNLNCSFCYNSGFRASNVEIPVEKITHFIHQAIPVMCEKPILTILGGEPTIRKDETLMLAKWAVENGFKTTVSTNGILIDHDFAKKAADYGINVQVSIDGPTFYEHEILRGRRTFERAKKAVKILVDSGVKVVTNMVVHKDNQWRIEDYFKFSKKIGVAGVRFVPLRRIGGGSNLQPPDLLKMIRSVRTIFSLNPRYRALASEDWFSSLVSICRLNKKKTSCGAGKSTLLIDPDGAVYPCTGQAMPEYLLGSIDQPFHRIWKYSHFLSGLRKRLVVDKINSKCASCYIRYWCGSGCRGETYSRTGSFQEPSPACEEIKKSITEMFWILSETDKFKWETVSPCSGK